MKAIALSMRAQESRQGFDFKARQDSSIIKNRIQYLDGRLLKWICAIL